MIWSLLTLNFGIIRKYLGRGRMDDLNEDFGVVSLLDRLNLAHSQEEDSAVDLDIFALVGGLNPAVG